jgi:hypothetical protein
MDTPYPLFPKDIKNPMSVFSVSSVSSVVKMPLSTQGEPISSKHTRPLWLLVKAS